MNYIANFWVMDEKQYEPLVAINMLIIAESVEEAYEKARLIENGDRVQLNSLTTSESDEQSIEAYNYVPQYNFYNQFKDVKIKIIDKEFLSKISRDKIILYLKKNNWKIHEEVRWGEEVKSHIWLKKESNKAIQIPIKASFLDYPIRIQEAINILAELENRSQLLIVQEISNLKAP